MKLNEAKKYCENVIGKDAYSQLIFNKKMNQRPQSAIKDLAHGRARVGIADVVEYFIFVTVCWIIQAAILFRVKLL